jgi:hypothetical protein
LYEPEVDANFADDNNDVMALNDSIQKKGDITEVALGSLRASIGKNERNSGAGLGPVGLLSVQNTGNARKQQADTARNYKDPDATKLSLGPSVLENLPALQPRGSVMVKMGDEGDPIIAGGHKGGRGFPSVVLENDYR